MLGPDEGTNREEGFPEKPKYMVEPADYVTYTYDAVGNSLTEEVDGEIKKYYYNENNQLTKTDDRTLKYDANGNVIEETSLFEQRSYTYDAANRIRAVMFGDDSYVTYGYDALDRKVYRESGMWRSLGKPNGEGHPGKGHGLNKDNPGKGHGVNKDNPGKGNGKGNGNGVGTDNHPGKGNAWGLYKQGQGKKKMEVVETRYLYEGLSHLVHKEYSPSGSPYAEYYIGANNRIVSQKMFGYHGRSIPGHDPTMKTTGGLMYYHYDGMSTVSELTDRHGAEIQSYRYDVFGGLVNGITAPFNTNSYTGHSYDQDVGLIDMRARMYDPSTARFLQEDTYAGELNTPLTQNRYSYVMNNPVNYWDPTGRVAENFDTSGIPDWVKARQDNFETNRDNQTRMSEESWTYQNYERTYGSDVRKQVTDNQRYLTVYYEIDARDTWYYDYTKTLYRLYPDGTIDFGSKIVANDESVQYVAEGIVSWEESISASAIAKGNQAFLSKHYKIPENATFNTFYTWAKGSYNAIFFDNPLTVNDYLQLMKSGEQSFSGIRHLNTDADPNGLMYYEFSDGTIVRENQFYKQLPREGFVSEIPLSASQPSWAIFSDLCEL
ncbi:RHS repeat-associated core domain-containing protein [Virgibacillus sp. LDC-1]|uniref:RHS repeat-associated core domain-containing protein n=2 Tax=unclassified Virgibacillus TaxID=2620237 RepID=UPI0024DE55B2|nr:RHS repeat-associated core domain-containing protein [Virgibacillus sp. LDC-1]